MTGGYYCISKIHSPAHNQAIVEYMYNHTPAGFVCMLIHADHFALSYGRNQSISRGQSNVVRRLTGGGTLSYRSGLLQVSFISARDDASIRRQSAVVSIALKLLGIDAGRSPENEITCPQGKLALNLWDKSGAIARQMLLLNLSVQPTAQNGLPIALSTFGVEQAQVMDALLKAFTSLYHVQEEMPLYAADEDIAEIASFLQSEEWLYREPLQNAVNEQFAWGNLELFLQAKDGVLQTCLLRSDGPYAEFLQEIPKVLQNSPYLLSAMKNRILAMPYANKNMQVVRDILRLLENYMQNS